jgi:HlyD family secretion protein
MTKNSNNKTFLPGDFIFREGEFGKVAYVIEEGDIELVKFTGDEYITLAEITKGALFGEMAIIDGSPRSGSARAKTSCILREVTEEQLKQYLSASPQTSLDMMRRLAGYARSANEKLNTDAFESSKKSEEDKNVNSTEIKNVQNDILKKEKIDNFTNKTLREFNDDIDQFSEINPNKPLFISGFVIILIVTAFVIWASVTSIDITVATRGQVSTEIPNVNVQSNYDSVIKKILVKEGDRVETGQILAKFDETLLASDIRDTKIKLNSNNDNLIRTQAELAYLDDKKLPLPSDKIQLAIFKGFTLEIDTQKNANKTKLNQLNVDLKIIKNEINFNKLEFDRQIELNRKKVGLKKDLEEARFKFKKSLLSETKLQSQIKDAVDSHQAYINQMKKTKNEELKSLIDSDIAMREKLIKLKRNRKDVELLSPISGTILKLEDNFEGSVIEPGDSLLTIVPENVDIHVLIDIDPKNITNVFEGAKVKILLDAMPSQKHGELVGELISISKDTRDEDISGEKSSMYRGKVKIVENNLRNTPKDFALLPGMNVSGNVISGTRPLITYLIYPVIKTINTAMREP